MNATGIPLKEPSVSAAAGATEQLERAYIDASTRVPVLMFYTSAMAWLILLNHRLIGPRSNVGEDRDGERVERNPLHLLAPDKGRPAGVARRGRASSADDSPSPARRAYVVSARLDLRRRPPCG